MDQVPSRLAGSKYKVEKNATIYVTQRGPNNTPVKVPVKALLKVGDVAVNKAERGGYNVTHASSGYVVNSMSGLSKNVAISAALGMASGRSASAMTAMSEGRMGKEMSLREHRTQAAISRYGRIVQKRDAAVALQSARESHARAVESGNQVAIRSAAGRVKTAESVHDIVHRPSLSVRKKK
jgi:hypothetical protein